MRGEALCIRIEFYLQVKILEKEFKVDTRGYRPQEVDKFLDIVIRDYEEFYTIIKEIENEKKKI